MEWLNYHHLLYFWQVAHAGSIAQASGELHLTPQTISAQLKSLEASLGKSLFRKRGRNLVLTEDGEEVLKYADRIFGLGRELLEKVGRPEIGPAMRLHVGVADVLSKRIVERLLDPVFALDEPVRLIVHEDKTERLLAEIATGAFDVALTDAPLPEQVRVRAYSHRLGECGAVLVATPDLARRYRRNFPASLNAAPFLLPTVDTMLRRSLDAWFRARGIRPYVIGEFADNALLKMFGDHGRGIFAVPAVIENHIRKMHRVSRVGLIEDAPMAFYAISTERRITHPAVAAITTAARDILFR